MYTDYHIHSSLSADSDAPMELMIEQGIKLGLSAMCFTEHMDFGYVDGDLNFEVDTDAYHKKYCLLKKQYASRIKLLFGIELGLQPQFAAKHANYLASYPFDFVIGSSHLVNGIDPYYPTFYEGRSEKESYQAYFESILLNLDAFSDIDVYGHIDYVVRYGPNKNKFYTYEGYREILEEILKKLILAGVGLEVNTAGYKYGLGVPNPLPEVIQSYRRLGGEIITIGSDAHSPEYLAYQFDAAQKLLLECGFRYYTVFENRIPEFLPLDN